MAPKRQRLQRAIAHGSTVQSDLKKTLAYFQLAKFCGLKPWEVERMDSVMVEEWLTIIGELKPLF